MAGVEKNAVAIHESCRGPASLFHPYFVIAYAGPRDDRAGLS